MPKTKTVQISKDGIYGTVDVRALKAWEQNGWTVVDDGNSETDSAQDETVLTAVGETSDQDKE